MKSQKAKLRMLDAIEKMRKTLSANSDTSLSIDCLLEDEDMNYTLTRDDLEKLINPMVVELRKVL
jgi:heat shock protein 4